MAVEEKEILLCWKEISAYLGCEIRTCQRWEKEAGLPVHRILDSPKSRVFAYKQELDEWIKEKTKSPRKNKWKYLYFSFPLAALVLIYFVFLMPLRVPQPHDFRIEDSSLVILDKNNHKLWSYDTGIRGLQDEEFYRNHFQVRRLADAGLTIDLPLIVIKNIDHDLRKEVLFAQIPIDTSYSQCKLFCFSSKGQKRWTFEPGKEMTFGEKNYSARYGLKGFTVADLQEEKASEIIAVSYHRGMFPTQFAVLNSKGELLRDYWNSGRIYDFSFYDLDDNGEKEIILAGCNNEYDKGCLIVLEPDFKSGGSPQTGYYKSPELNQGVEKHYLLFPNTLADKRNEYKRGNIMRIHLIDDKIISAETKSGIYFEFDFNMELKEIRFADRYEDLHNEAYEEGITQKRFSPKIMAELKSELMPEVLYFTGKNWINRPLMAKNPFPNKKK